jgi:hypothetical protein
VIAIHELCSFAYARSWLETCYQMVEFACRLICQHHHIGAVTVRIQRAADRFAISNYCAATIVTFWVVPASADTPGPAGLTIRLLPDIAKVALSLE